MYLVKAMQALQRLFSLEHKRVPTYSRCTDPDLLTTLSQAPSRSLARFAPQEHGVKLSNSCQGEAMLWAESHSWNHVTKRPNLAIKTKMLVEYI
jgi:hypothetical protein